MRPPLPLFSSNLRKGTMCSAFPGLVTRTTDGSAATITGSPMDVCDAAGTTAAAGTIAAADTTAGATAATGTPGPPSPRSPRGSTVINPITGRAAHVTSRLSRTLLLPPTVEEVPAGQDERKHCCAH